MEDYQDVISQQGAVPCATKKHHNHLRVVFIEPDELSLCPRERFDYLNILGRCAKFF